MTTPTISQLYRFANLQMAAETRFELFGNTASEAALTFGNKRSSRFPAALAQQFAATYEILSHRENTTTGFSGTLFRAMVSRPEWGVTVGDLTLCIRSTEFIDDAARDNASTNKIEIRDSGFAFGQIADMKAWFDQLNADPNKLGGKNFALTGYSLGGNVATAFNLLMREAGQAHRITATYTFNGAGVGTVTSGTLTDVISAFNQQRTQGSLAFFQRPESATLYANLRNLINGAATVTIADMNNALSQIGSAQTAAQGLPVSPDKPRLLYELSSLLVAVTNAKSILGEALRAPTLTDPTGAPENISPGVIDATKLDYQMAVLQAREVTDPFQSNIIDEYGAAYAVDRALASAAQRAGLSPFYDVYGAPPPSAVANSQIHYGQPVPLFIEDQPLFRGDFGGETIRNTLLFGELKLLGNNFSLADFGDTHSLVLLVDSLSVMDTLARLDTTFTADTGKTIFEVASNLTRQTLPFSQGGAEGDVLERVVNALADTLGHSGWTRLVGSTAGNTWATMEDAGGATGRATFHAALKTLIESPSFQALVGKLEVTPLTAQSSLGSTASTDFGDFIALKTLSPFALKAQPGQQVTLNSVWNSVHNADFTAWGADQALTPAQRAGGLATFSDYYYADRATLLATLLERNQTNNSTGVVPLPGMRPDIATTFDWFENGIPNILIAQAPNRRPIVQSVYVAFADDASRSLTGMNGGNDRLYGGAGNDLLKGLAGNDYLEGGRGADRLEGGTGHDTLLGGAGIDELLGGTGNDWLLGGADADLRLEGGDGIDRLEGGAGFDNYYLSTSDTAVDTISDSGDDGRLWVDGTMIGGFTTVRAGLYESTGGLYRMAVLGDGSTTSTAMVYRKSDGRTLANIIGIAGSTVLGYTLPAPPAPPAPNFNFTRGAESDLYRVWFAHGGGIAQLISGTGLADGAGANDWIEGGAFTNMEIRGGLGNDQLIDLKISNPAQEAQQTTTLIGGAGSDFLYGRGGTLYLDGGADNDFISSARFDSAPEFKTYLRNGSGGLDEFLTSTPAIVADMGIKLSLAPVDVNGAIGSYDTTLARWEFYYRPIAAGTVTAAGNLRGEAGSAYSLVMRNDGGGLYLGAPGAAPPLSLPVTQYTASWTTGANDPLRAADVTVRRSDGGTLNTVIAQVLSSTVPTSTMARDGNDNSAELAFIDAGSGDDIVFGGAGRDIIQGGIGNDRIDGAGGEDFIDGGGGDDFLVGGRFNDVIAGGDNNDILHGGGESDSLYGGSGNDVLLGDFYQASYDSYGSVISYTELQPAGNDLLDGGDGNDILDGGRGNDVLFGGAGDDTLDGGPGSDVLHGGDGNDILISHRGDGLGNDDVLDGGAGNDTYVFESHLYVVCDNIGSVEGFGNTTIDDTAGLDTVRTNFFRANLPTGVENLQLNGFAVGAGNINLGQYLAWGSDARARYEGNAADNVIDASNVGQQAGFIDAFLGGVVIDGGMGADTMIGSTASDTYIVDNVGDVVIESNAGFSGDTSIDRIVTPFATTLSANLEEVELTGTDSVAATGNARDNLLLASTNSGANVLAGLAGNDTYRIGLNDTVVEATGAGNDTVEIDGQITSDLRGQTFDLANYANVENLKIYKGSSGGVTLRGNSGNNILYGSAGGGNLIDGGAGNDTIWDFDQSQYWDRLFQQILIPVPINGSDRLVGGAGNDSIVSTGGADLLDGGTGNDLLEARLAGSRTIVFGTGYGIDTVTFTGVTGSHTLSWTAGTDFSSLRSQRVGNNLQLTLNTGADRLELVNYYSADPTQRPEFNQWQVGDQLILPRAAIDTFLATGAPGIATAASDFLAAAAAGSTINALAGDDYVLGANGNDVLSGGTGNDYLSGGSGNDTLNGGDGNDQLDGGAGNDQLTGGLGNDEITGGAGADVIHFSLGSGQDRIKNNLLSTVDGVDVLRFDASISPANVTVTADNFGGLVVSIAGGDQIIVDGSQRDFNDTVVSQGFLWTAGDTQSTLDRIEFSDGTVWTHADLISRAYPRFGTAGNDTLIAPHGYSAHIDGLAGNDILIGRDGNDTLIGGAGYDQLQGGGGDDLLDGGDGGGWLRGEAGDDVLIGGTGDDTLDGGTGADSMTGGSGNDTYEIDDINDVIIEAAAGGTDMVKTHIDYVLGPNLENLSLFAAGLRGEGNSSANTLFGSTGDDILVGGGGIDHIDGGGGNDLYIGAGDGDNFVSYPGTGIKTIDNVAAANPALGALLLSDPSVLPGDLIVTRGTGSQADDLLIAFRGVAGQVVIKNHFLLTAGQRRNGISSIQFADGHTFDRSAIDSWVGVAPANGADLNANSVYGTSSNDFLYGTANGDRIYGLAGADFLYGGAGADTLAGSLGDDIYDVDHIDDYVYEAPNAGTDSVQATISYSLPAGIENLYLMGASNIDGTGNSGANSLFGNAGNNRLAGGAGNDYLDGAAGDDVIFGDDGNDSLIGGLGADTLSGGLGNDTYYVDSTADVVNELPGEGTDTVFAPITWSLAVNVDNLTLTGASAINGIGNALNNVITGNSAANVLTGGAGNDTYVVDALDTINEGAGEGTDTVQTSVTYTLGANVENLTLTGTAAINGTGNSLSNLIIGNSAANTLNGGAGADTMQGGGGNDIYIVDNTGDVVTEAASAGTDRVDSSVSYTLGANIENITLTGTAAINATGNSSNNTLTGNSGANRLDGGAGNDTMIGGAGNDTYVVGSTGDVVTEAASAGTDTVESSITYTLGTNVENLTLTGSSVINGTGNSLANTLIGNSAANTLDGSTGADSMSGGAGNDVYIVDNAGDVVTEAASAGTDRIDASVSFTLSANVENLTLTGTSSINATGNTLNNVLTGNAGANRLDGGAGNDTMAGGAGNDVYVVDSTGDVVTEAASAGTDRVESSITYTLGANVEDLTLTGTASINATGNTLNNALTGNSGANTLNGGSGADTMAGGAGNDIYIVDNTGDVVTEALSAGTDRVDASVTHTLGANIENLTLTGTGAINGTGNTLDNALTGNSAANVLSGGAGNDTLTDAGGANVLIGGAGNDTLNITSTSVDRIAMARGHGSDIVVSSGTAANDVLEVSNGIAKSAMALMKTGNDLVVDLGSGETVTLRNWYATTSVRNVGTLKIIGDAGWVPGQTGTPAQVETLSMAALASAFDAARTTDPTLTRWPLDSFGSMSVSSISTMRFGHEADADLIRPVGRAGALTGSKLALLGEAAETTSVWRSPTLADDIPQAVAVPSATGAEWAVTQPRLKSLMKFWDAVEAPSTPEDMVLGAPRAISVAGGTAIPLEGGTSEWAHTLPAARMLVPEEALNSHQPVRVRPVARTEPWWESTQITAKIGASLLEQIGRNSRGWATLHSELATQLTHATESAFGEALPPLPSLSTYESLGWQRGLVAEEAHRATGMITQKLQ